MSLIQLFSYIYDLIHNSRGMRIEYLPAYSPDFNPIEQAFSAIKSHLRREGNIARIAWGDKNDLDVYMHLFRLVYSISPLEAHGFFHHSRYI